MKKYIGIFVLFGLLFGFGLTILVSTTFADSISAINPSIKILYPTGGETFHPGDKVSVTWTSSGIPVDSKIDLMIRMDQIPGSPVLQCGVLGVCSDSKDNGNTNLITANTGSAVFTLPSSNLPTYNKYYFYIEAFKDSVDSNGPVHTSYASNITGNINGTIPVVNFFSIDSSQKANSQANNNLVLPNISKPITIVSLSIGSSGNTVTNLQQLLINQGYLKMTSPTGYFGSLTKKAVIAFQKANGIKPDGTVGTKTLALLNGTIIQNTTPITTCTSTSAPSITVTSPKAGDIFSAGQIVPVTWISCNVQNVSVEMAQGGHDMGRLSQTNIPASQGSYLWTVPSAQWQSNSGFFVGVWDVDYSHLDVLGKSGLFTINSSSTQIQSSTITASDAYKICNKSSCPKEEVTLTGELRRGGDSLNLFVLSDDSKKIMVTLNANTSLLDEIKLNENLFIIANGKVQAEVKGTLSYNSQAFCTMNSCQQVVNLSVKEPSSFKFIKKVGCVANSNLSLKDCYSLLIGGRSMSDAYTILVNSNLYKNNKYNLTGLIVNDSDAYNFQVNTSEGGCSSYYDVYAGKILYERKCAKANPGNLSNLELEEKI